MSHVLHHTLVISKIIFMSHIYAYPASAACSASGVVTIDEFCICGNIICDICRLCEIFLLEIPEKDITSRQ